ncbi:hypothetical protein Dimus_016881 [Dionaea muscipula]
MFLTLFKKNEELLLLVVALLYCKLLNLLNFLKLGVGFTILLTQICATPDIDSNIWIALVHEFMIWITSNECPAESKTKNPFAGAFSVIAQEQLSADKLGERISLKIWKMVAHGSGHARKLMPCHHSRSS